jgi:hypothetical protein
MAPPVEYDPAAQLPLQDAKVSMSAVPYLPAGQSEQTPAPAAAYLPLVHPDAVAMEEPRGQK